MIKYHDQMQYMKERVISGLQFQRDRSSLGWENIAAIGRHAAGSGEMGNIFNHRHEEQRLNHKQEEAMTLEAHHP